MIKYGTKYNFIILKLNSLHISTLHSTDFYQFYSRGDLISKDSKFDPLDKILWPSNGIIKTKLSEHWS